MENINYIENHCISPRTKCVVMMDGEYFGYGGISGGEAVVDHRHGGSLGSDSSPIEFKMTTTDKEQAVVFDNVEEVFAFTLSYTGSKFKILPA